MQLYADSKSKCIWRLVRFSKTINHSFGCIAQRFDQVFFPRVCSYWSQPLSSDYLQNDTYRKWIKDWIELWRLKLRPRLGSLNYIRAWVLQEEDKIAMSVGANVREYIIWVLMVDVFPVAEFGLVGVWIYQSPHEPPHASLHGLFSLLTSSCSHPQTP